MFLEAHFGEVELHMPEKEPEDDHWDPNLLVVLDDAEAQISLVTLVSSSFSFEPYLLSIFILYLSVSSFTSTLIT
jgi:hypothetical protein